VGPPRMRSNAVGGGGGDCTLSLAWEDATMMPLQFHVLRAFLRTEFKKKIMALFERKYFPTEDFFFQTYCMYSITYCGGVTMDEGTSLGVTNDAGGRGGFSFMLSAQFFIWKVVRRLDL
jgi:hypothetical protein